MTATTAQLLDGKALAAARRAELATRIQALGGATRRPCLAVVLVGQDPASQVYVRNKKRACEEAGITSQGFDLPATASQDDILAVVERLNADPGVDGILVQLPLPKGVDSQAVIAAIDPTKDVDGFHPINVGRLALGLPAFAPCTPLGVMVLLRQYGVAIAGRHAVVIGRSAIVGKPMATMLLAADATVTVCHSRTPDLAAHTRGADLIVAAVGRVATVTADMVKPGCTVVDVGMNRDDAGKLVGDVAFAEVASRAAWITPVPGGVGPMTIAMLLENTMTSFERRHPIR